MSVEERPSPSTAVRQGALIGAELGLLGVALAVVTSFQLVFSGISWWWRLAIPACAAWALSVTTRRSGMRAATSLAVQIFCATILLSWAHLRDETVWGLPTTSTWSALTRQVGSAFSPFAQLVAPVPPHTGFLVVAAAALWVMIVFADFAAIRFRAPVQAILVYLATVVALGALGRTHGTSVATITVALALVLYATTQQAFAASNRRWVLGRVRSGVLSVASASMVVALTAALSGTLVGRYIGTGQPVLDLRQFTDREDSTKLVSPFVSIRSMLGERSDDVMFEVAADSPSYWRLTALDHYDPERDIWTSRGSYEPVRDELPPVIDPAIPVEPLTQEYRIVGLGPGWLPAAYAPSRVDSEQEIRFNSASASLLATDSADQEGRDSTTGLEYTVSSDVPELGEVVRSGGSAPGASGGSTPGDIVADQTPVSLSPLVESELVAATAAHGDAVSRLLALQNWFRDSFTYDDQVDFSGSPDPLTSFVEARRGFCQQFSSAFALLARSLGLPSRVAVGFTQGDAVQQGATVSYVVRGRHAHAWPEVLLDGIGWVPFEPTPQRGDPQARDHTGVEAAQASPPPEQASTTTVSPPTTELAEPSAPAPSPTTPVGSTTSKPTADEMEDRSDHGALKGPAAVAAVVAALALFLAASLGRKRGRPRTGVGRATQVADAWQRALRALERSGHHPATGDTPIEFARAVDDELGWEVVVPLATIESKRRYGPGVPDTDEVDRAAAQVDLIEATLRGRRPVDEGGPSPSIPRR